MVVSCQLSVVRKKLSGVQVSGFRCQVSGFRFQVSERRCHVLAIGSHFQEIWVVGDRALGPQPKAVSSGIIDRYRLRVLDWY